MKKFLLLALVLALVALPMVMAYPTITGRVGDGSIGSDCDSSSSPGCQPGSCNSGLYCDSSTCACVPEFTTIGMGLAVAGAGLGYTLIRKRK